MINTLLLTTLLTTSPNASEDVVSVMGVIRLGPEQVSFLPCDEPFEERHWVNYASLEAVGWEDAEYVLNAQPLCTLSTIPCAAQQVKVIGTAHVTSRGQYGHMGKYPYEITFIQMEVMLDECPGTYSSK